MHFIFGGRGMGMLEYAKGLVEMPAVCDLEYHGAEIMRTSDIILNIQQLVKEMVSGGGSALDYFKDNIDIFRNKIVIGDEVGSGVVPVEPFEREWRDETGRVYQLLAARAADVTRLWAGIPQALKRGGRIDV